MSTAAERTLPANAEAEEATLGAMLVSPDAADAALERVTVEDFYWSANRETFGAIVALFGRGDPVDAITVVEELKRRGSLESVGGHLRIAELVESVTTPASVGHHAGIVRESAERRRVIQDAEQQLERAYSGELPEGDRERGRVVQLTTASAVKPERISWAWADRVPLRAVTLIAGPAGLGKTTISLELGARLSRGQLAGELRETSAGVLVASAEDSTSSTLVPRLIAAGADLGRVSFASAWRDGLAGSLAFPADVSGLADAIRETSARLVIIDPLSAHLEGHVNSWRDQDVRRALAPLARLAEETVCAVVLIAHLNKSGAGEALLRVGGSVGIHAAARAVLIVARDPDAPDGPTRILASAKSNLGAEPAALRFRVEGREIVTQAGESISTSGITWEGEAAGLSADQLVQQLDPDERGERAEASEWLRDYLANGPRGAKETLDSASAAGINGRTLRRAKADLAVRSSKDGLGGPWSWSLPAESPSEGGLKGGQYLSVGHLRDPETPNPQVSPEDGHLSGGVAAFEDGHQIAIGSLRGSLPDSQPIDPGPSDQDAPEDGPPPDESPPVIPEGTDPFAGEPEGEVLDVVRDADGRPVSRCPEDDAPPASLEEATERVLRMFPGSEVMEGTGAGT